jgi:hypothetical protein
MKCQEPTGADTESESLPRTLTEEEYRLILGFHRDANLPIEINLDNSQVAIISQGDDA